IKSDFPKFIVSPDSSVGTIFLLILKLSFKLGIRIALILIILAILDFIYQRYTKEQQMKMTKEEIKEERKQAEGDPKIKSRIRAIQIEMARRRMMAEVPEAAVVITNPTFLAIAVKYKVGVMSVPVVAAKGMRKTAQKIKEIAVEHSIPIVEDKPLARLMYPKIEVGQEIPFEFFAAVAEILAYIYRMNNPDHAFERGILT
ncbi:MAG: EscU/YscU/HrcU family type III secretion system export apparatus switch protein, partial [bacterium]